MVANVDLDEESVVCSVEPHALAVDFRWRRRVCACCFTVKAEELVQKCDGCGSVFYCSTACAEQHATAGGPGTNAHHLICRTYAQLNTIPAEHRIFLALLLEAYAADAVAGASDAPIGAITFADLQHHSYDAEAERTHAWSKSFAHFRKLIETCEWCPWRDDQAKAPDDATLYADLSRITSNAFGTSSGSVGDGGDEDDKSNPLQCCAGVYPAASIFNHSCAPNCQTTTGAHRLLVSTRSDVASGTELTISYIDTSLPVATRRKLLWQTYRFVCGCERCESEGGPAESYCAIRARGGAPIDNPAAAGVDVSDAHVPPPPTAQPADLLFNDVDDATGEALLAACDDANLDSRGTVDAAARIVSWSVGGVIVRVEQQPTLADTAALMWVDAVALAQYIYACALPPGSLGKVVDLGCGTGGLGLWVANSACSTHVTLADRPSRLHYLRANAALNGHSAVGGAVSVRAVDFSSRDDARSLAGSVDTCLASALVYDASMHDALIATLVALEPRRLLLANSDWSPIMLAAFVDKLGEHFTCTHAHRVPADHNLGGGGYAVDIWECTPRHAPTLYEAAPSDTGAPPATAVAASPTPRPDPASASQTHAQTTADNGQVDVLTRMEARMAALQVRLDSLPEGKAHKRERTSLHKEMYVLSNDEAYVAAAAERTRHARAAKDAAADIEWAERIEQERAAGVAAAAQRAGMREDDAAQRLHFRSMVTSLFEEYAPTFEASLHSLGYATPDRMAEALLCVHRNGAGGKGTSDAAGDAADVLSTRLAVDLGCGTRFLHTHHSPASQPRPAPPIPNRLQPSPTCPGRHWPLWHTAASPLHRPARRMRSLQTHALHRRQEAPH